MSNLLKSLFGINTARSNRDRKSRLQVETLETRLVPATPGVFKTAILDFEGRP